MKFGHLILRKIFKFIAIRRQILRLKIPIQFRRALFQTPLGSLQRPPNLLAAFKVSTLCPKKNDHIFIFLITRSNVNQF